MGKAKIKDLKGSEIDKLANLALAVEVLLDEEIRERNEEGRIYLTAARATIEALRNVIYEG